MDSLESTVVVSLITNVVDEFEYLLSTEDEHDKFTKFSVRGPILCTGIIVTLTAVHI